MRAITRRGLLGGAAALVAGVAGAGAGWLSAPGKLRPAPPPRRAAVLEAELTRERNLIAQLEVAAVASPALAAKIAVLRVDHAAHAEAIAALLTAAGLATTTPVSSAAARTNAPTPRAPASVADLRAAETSAASAAAAASLQTTGTAAVTLASMSACESTHVAWLS